MGAMELSVVIPVYNEEANLLPLMEELKGVLEGMGREYEVIFVDDGSTDGSASVLREMASRDTRVKVIRFRRNCGQTAAFDAGFKAAQGKVIVTMDADLQNDPKDIPLLLERIGEYDLVAGWRHRRKDPWLKVISSKIANSIRNWVLREEIRDTGCSLKAFRRECLQGIKLFEGMHRFFPTLLRMEGFRVLEVKVNHRHRRFGRTKYNIRNRIWRALVDLLAVRWMKRRHLDYEIEEVFP